MEKNVDIIVTTKRPEVVSFGAMYGKRIFKVEAVDVVTDFNKKSQEARDNHGVFINRNLKRYKVKGIDVVSMSLGRDLNDAPVVIINQGTDTEVVCPLSDSKFTTEVSMEKVKEAIDNTCVGRARFFSNGKKLVDFLNRQNDNEVSNIDNLIMALKQMKETIQKTSEKNTSDVQLYYNQLDNKPCPSVTVTIEED